MSFVKNIFYEVSIYICAAVVVIAPCHQALGETEAALPLQPDGPSQPEERNAISRAGFVRDSTMTLLFRNYAEVLDIERTTKRIGWVQGMQARFESGMTEGPVGFGIDFAPFVALKLDGGEGSRNLVHLEPDGSGQNDKFWSYLGTYAFKAEFSNTLFKVGKEMIINPYLDPYDIRALPPSFRGTSFVNHSFSGLTLSGGSFNAVNARGATQLQPLSTNYGGTAYDRLSYVGGDWKLPGDIELSLYASQAKDVWNQYYVSASHSFGSQHAIRWQVKADSYFTYDQGKKLQGAINNKAASLMLSAKYGASNLVFGYQRIFGDQFFDFAGETAGIYLVNSMGVDYNAPHEQSAQIRYKIDGTPIGAPGFQLSLWGVKAWGVEAANEAKRNAATDANLHGLYWKGGLPIAGGHAEHGVQAKYTLQQGLLKGMSFMYIYIGHRIDPTYPSKNFEINRVMINYPVLLF
ncbi:hypothetical protein AAKU61_004311 [Undibacterium sp. GrIS 1.2]|uniref:OprD family outer membrane porin n=1 Tax=Undibacterium sp. GrIS 1.2 TaxID=3143933 RepID=UPI0033949959